MPKSVSPLFLPAVLMLAVYAALAVVAPTDFDYWWHLSTGRWIAAYGVPQVDPFSYTAGSRAWLDHEWLTQWLMQALEARHGYRGPVALFAAIQALTGLVLLALLRQRGIGTAASLVGLVLFMLLAAPTWGVRPQIVTALLLGLELWLLERYRQHPESPLPLLVLPVLLMLWANVHGSFIAGLGVIGLHVIGALADSRLHGRPRLGEATRLLACAVVATLATLANPYGMALWLLPLDYVSATGSEVLQSIDEWRSPDFHGAHAWLIPLLLVPLLLTGLRRPLQTAAATRATGIIDPTDALLVLTFLALALRARYHAPLYGMAVLPVALAAIPPWPAAGSATLGSIEARLHLLLAPLLSVALLTVAVRLPVSQWRDHPAVDGRLPYPARAVDWLKAQPGEPRLFNDLGWGGYLLHRLGPAHKVFIDGRLDLYRGPVFDDYAAITDLLPGWRQRLEAYRIDTVLIRAGTALDEALAHDPMWRSRHRDALAVVYVVDHDPVRTETD
jgi:hypothetical protein